MTSVARKSQTRVNSSERRPPFSIMGLLAHCMWRATCKHRDYAYSGVGVIAEFKAEQGFTTPEKANENYPGTYVHRDETLGTYT